MVQEEVALQTQAHVGKTSELLFLRVISGGSKSLYTHPGQYEVCTGMTMDPTTKAMFAAMYQKRVRRLRDANGADWLTETNPFWAQNLAVYRDNREVRDCTKSWADACDDDDADLDALLSQMN